MRCSCGAAYPSACAGVAGLDCPADRLGEPLEPRQHCRVRVARERLARRLRQRLAVGLTDIEHGDRAEVDALILVARGVIVRLVCVRRQNSDRVLALPDLAAELLPLPKPRDARTRPGAAWRSACNCSIEYRWNAARTSAYRRQPSDVSSSRAADSIRSRDSARFCARYSVRSSGENSVRRPTPTPSR